MNLDIHTSNFAYMLGNFMADGSFYKSGKRFWFEFTDGSPYKNELKYSFEHIKKIKALLESFLNKKLPNIRNRGNRYSFSFNDSLLKETFENLFHLSPGDKSRTIDIPTIYRDSPLEADFWRGYLDGDGSIARRFRKVSVESMSEAIINSFAEFLRKKDIYFSQYRSKRGEDFSHVIVIRSVSFRDFARRIGFNHPSKSKLLAKKLNDSDFFVKNNLSSSIILNKIIDYSLIFDKTVFVEDGLKILREYRDTHYYQGNNIRFEFLFNFLLGQGLTKNKALVLLSKYRFKKSKGSRNSIKLPFYYNRDILTIAKYVRLRAGSITFSKAYIESFNEDYQQILNLTQRIFEILPKYTCKNEPIFCSGILRDFFSHLIQDPKLINGFLVS